MAHDDDVRRSVYALARRDLASEDLFRSTVAVLRRAAPVDGWCALTIDPVTLLPTGGVHDEGVQPERFPRLLELEYTTSDAHRFVDLAASRAGIGVLSAAAPGQSPRFREVLQPNGFADELRVALRVSGRTWGGLVLLRRNGTFESSHAALLRDVAVYLAVGIRRSLVSATKDGPRPAMGPGVVIFDDGRVEAATPAAQQWIEDIDEVGLTPDGLPPSLLSLVEHVRTARPGSQTPSGRTRARTRSGRWLLMHAAALDSDGDRIAVTIEPADPMQLAPLLMEAYNLTEREREVVELVLRGRSTREIVDTLFVSSHTVQDHLKSIFDKMGVRSRREIVTTLLYQHYLPAIEAQRTPSVRGWFAG